MDVGVDEAGQHDGRPVVFSGKLRKLIGNVRAVSGPDDSAVRSNHHRSLLLEAMGLRLPGIRRLVEKAQRPSEDDLG